jgi:hypothetical protein
MKWGEQAPVPEAVASGQEGATMGDLGKPLIRYESPVVIRFATEACECVCSNGSAARLSAICNAGTSNQGTGTCQNGTGVVSCTAGNRVMDAGCSTGATRNPAGCRNGSSATPGCVAGTTPTPSGSCNTGNGVA